MVSRTLTPGDLRDDVVQALEVLDVDGGVDVDAGGEQLLDVLPALGVARAGDVGVGQLVDQQQGRVAGERRVEVELLERRAPVLELPAGQDCSSPSSRRAGLRPAVGLHDADHDVEAVRALRRGRPRAW